MEGPFEMTQNKNMCCPNPWVFISFEKCTILNWAFSEIYYVFPVFWIICQWTSLLVQRVGICLPVQGTQVWSLVPEDPTCRGAAEPLCHSCWPSALELASRNCWALVLPLLKLARLEPVSCNKKSHHNEKPMHRSCTEPMQSNEDLVQPKTNK